MLTNGVILMSNYAASAIVSPEDRVRAIAFSLWVDEGMPEGLADSHWFKALDLANSAAPESAGAEESAAQPKRKTPAAAAPKKVAAVAAAKKAAPRKRD